MTGGLLGPFSQNRLFSRGSCFVTLAFSIAADSAVRGKSECDLALPHLIMGLKSDMKLFTSGEMPTFRETVEWPFSHTECFKPLPWGEGRKVVLKGKNNNL